MIMLYNNVFTEIKKVVFSKYFIVAMVILYLSTLFSCAYSSGGTEYYVIDYLFSNNSAIFKPITLDETFYQCIHSNITEMILPAVVGFPISMCFCEETKTHANRFILIRTNKKNYIISKVISIVICVTTMWVIALILFLISILNICEYDTITFHVEFVFLVIISIYYALLNLLVAILVKNIYMAVCLPFLLCYILSAYSSFLVRKNIVDFNIAMLINPYNIVTIKSLDLNIAIKVIVFIAPPMILIALIHTFFNKGVDICE